MKEKIIFKRKIREKDLIIWNTGLMTFGDENEYMLETTLNIDLITFPKEGKIMRLKDMWSNTQIIRAFKNEELPEALLETISLKQTCKENEDVALVLGIHTEKNLTLFKNLGLEFDSDIQIIPYDAKLISNSEIEFYK